MNNIIHKTNVFSTISIIIYVRRFYLGNMLVKQYNISSLFSNALL